MSATDDRPMVVWGWDCIDCGGDFGVNDCCDSCAGTNRIPVYVTKQDAERFRLTLPVLRSEPSS